MLSNEVFQFVKLSIYRETVHQNLQGNGLFQSAVENIYPYVHFKTCSPCHLTGIVQFFQPILLFFAVQKGTWSFTSFVSCLSQLNKRCKYRFGAFYLEYRSCENLIVNKYVIGQLYVSTIPLY